jgi:hypothetical protein
MIVSMGSADDVEEADKQINFNKDVVNLFTISGVKIEFYLRM